ncbi:alkene reductase [Streptosporangium sp. NPDC000396]|uniref:alkene reductase n=1 Tax=Streptosporangium sp. NPDC000396 TaxID=3366185 RepID=UPI0036A5D040
MNATPALFRPVELGALTLPNRIVMAPMTRSRAAADGTPTPLMATYYAQRASAGLIITEGTHPSPAGRIGPAVPGLHTDEHQRGWARIADAVHEAGGHVFVQLMHAGRLAHPGFLDGLHPVAPSPVRANTSVYTPDGRVDAVTPRELTDAQIRQIVDDFARASRRAIAAGLDGVEIHAANGYLLHQFLGDSSNLRTDAWGGDTAGRIRVVAEVVRVVAEAVGPDRVGLRISPGNRFGDLAERNPHEVYAALVRELADDPIVYLHLKESGDVPLDGLIRELWPTALVVTPLNSPSDLTKTDSAAWWLERGADMIAFGSAFIANPDLVERLRIGAPLNHLAPIPDGVYGGGPKGYTDYPTLRDLV